VASAWRPFENHVQIRGRRSACEQRRAHVEMRAVATNQEDTMTLEMRYVVASRTTGHVHWHGDPVLLRRQVDDAADAEKARHHVDLVAAAHPSGGPYELRAVTLKEFRWLLLQAGALMLHGRGDDTLECLLDDPS